MRSLSVCAIVGLFLAAPSAVRGQSARPSPEVQARINDIVDRVNKSESAVIVRMRMYHPLVEVYIQNLALDEQLGWVPTQDDYFLGQFHIGDAPQLRQLSQAKKTRSFASRLPGGAGTQYLPDGFAAMAAPDWRLLEREPIRVHASYGGNSWARPDASCSTSSRSGTARKASPGGSGSTIAITPSSGSTASTGAPTRRCPASSAGRSRFTWTAGA